MAKMKPKNLDEALEKLDYLFRVEFSLDKYPLRQNILDDFVDTIEGKIYKEIGWGDRKYKVGEIELYSFKLSRECHELGLFF